MLFLKYKWGWREKTGRKGTRKEKMKEEKEDGREGEIIQERERTDNILILIAISVV